MIICSAFSFTTMNVFARLAGDIPPMQKTFFRNAVALVVIGIMLISRKQPVHLKKGTLHLHIFRSAFGVLGVVGNFYAVDHMLLSDATMLVELSPFFIIVFSSIFLKETASWRQWFLIALALAGAAFVIKPTNAILTNSSAVVALAASVMAGLAYTMVRALNLHEEDGTITILFFSAFSCLICLPSMLANFSLLTLRQLAFLMGAAVFACSGQFAVTEAYRFAPAAEISIFDYSQIIFSAIYGWFIFQQLADIGSYIGYAIILTSALLMFLPGRQTEASVNK